MMKLTTAVVLLAVLLAAIPGMAAMPTSPTKFDEFKDLNCEDEMARLDNFVISLQADPNAMAVLIFYGGRRIKGRLPKRGHAAARADRMKTYLVQRRGIPASRLIMLDGGYRQEWMAELWLVPAGAVLPSPTPSVRAVEMKFRKGKARPRDFRCEI